jgi:hypothetical protein
MLLRCSTVWQAAARMKKSAAPPLGVQEDAALGDSLIVMFYGTVAVALSVT